MWSHEFVEKVKKRVSNKKNIKNNTISSKNACSQSVSEKVGNALLKTMNIKVDTSYRIPSSLQEQLYCFLSQEQKDESDNMVPLTPLWAHDTIFPTNAGTR